MAVHCMLLQLKCAIYDSSSAGTGDGLYDSNNS